MPSSVRVVKADLGGDKRRVPCDSPSFGALMGKLAEAYGYSAGQLTARYVDDENDLITVVNDDDLAMAWEVLGEDKYLLKLSLTVETGATHRGDTGATAPAAAPATEPAAGLPPAFMAIAAQILPGLEAPEQVEHAVKNIAPRVLAQMEKLPEKLEALGRHVSEAVEAAAAEAAQHQDQAGAQATEAAARATATAQAFAAKARALRGQGLNAASETVQHASEAAGAAASQAMQAASQAVQAAGSVQLDDFLPPAYREAVSHAMAMAATEIDQAADFLPPAYREAVAAAMAPPAAASAAASNELPTAEDCIRQLADRFGVEPDAIALDSLELAELRTVANEAESIGQLQVIEAAMKARCHLGIWCDQTGMKPIRGVRYTRRNGNDTYDLCEAAWTALPQDEQASFTAVERPQVAILLRTSRAVVDTEHIAPTETAADENTVSDENTHAVPVLATASVGDAEDGTPRASDESDALLVSVSSSTPEEDRSTAAVDSSAVAPVEVIAAEPVPAAYLATAAADSLAAVPEAYRMQVERLLEMGYGPDVARLSTLVAAHDGDIRATIMALLDD